MGLPHSPGFPNYVLMGKLFSLIPFIDSVAVKINLLSLVFGIASLLMAYVVISKINRHPDSTNRPPCPHLSAFIASLFLMFSVNFWSQSIIAEIYTLHLFIMVVALSLLLREVSSHQPLHAPYWFAIAVLFGFGLGVHEEMVILFPVILLALWMKDKSMYRNPAFLASLAGFVILGGLSYLVLPIRSNQAPVIAPGNLQHFNQLYNFLSHKEFSHKIFSRSIPAMLHLATLFGSYLRDNFTTYGILLGLTGIIFHWVKHLKTGALCSLLFIINLALGLVYGHPERIEPEFGTYFIPAYWIWSIWLGIGLYQMMGLLHQLTRWLFSSKVIVQKSVFVTLATLLILFLIFPLVYKNGTNYWYSRKAFGIKEDTPKKFAVHLLTSLPAGSTVIVRNIYVDFTFLYLQQVEQLRPDVKVISLNRENQLPKDIVQWLQANPQNSNIYAEYDLIASNHLESNFYPSGFFGRLSPLTVNPGILKDTLNPESYWDALMEDMASTDESGHPIIIHTNHPIAVARSNLSVLYARLNLWDNAYRESDYASLYEPDYAEPYLLRGIWKLNDHRPDEAIRELQTCTQLNPIAHEGWLNLGTAYAQLGQWQLARNHFQKALRLNPSSVPAQINLQRLQQQSSP